MPTLEPFFFFTDIILARSFDRKGMRCIYYIRAKSCAFRPQGILVPFHEKNPPEVNILPCVGICGADLRLGSGGILAERVPACRTDLAGSRSGSSGAFQICKLIGLGFCAFSVTRSVYRYLRILGSWGSWDPKTNALARSFFQLTRSVYRSISGGQYGGESVYVYAEIDFSGDLYARIHICSKIQNTSIPLIARLSGFSGTIPHSSQLFPKITFSE